MLRGLASTATLSFVSALVSLATLGAPGTAAGQYKALVCFFADAIGAEGTVWDNGLLADVPIGGPAQAVESGTTSHVMVHVYQAATDTLAVGRHTSGILSPGAPDTFAVPVRVHVTGQGALEPGPATVSYFAEERFRGQVVREWSRTAEVLLVPGD